MIFFGPRTNSALVTNIHFVLHASHGSLPTETLGPNAALPAVSKFCHNEPSKYEIQHNSKPSLNARILFLYCILQQSMSHHPAFFTSQLFTLPADYFYKKDERVQLCNLRNSTFCASRPPTPPPPPRLFSFAFYINKLTGPLFSGLFTLGSLTNVSKSLRPASGDRGSPVCLDTIVKSVHNFKFCSQALLFAVIKWSKNRISWGHDAV